MSASPGHDDEPVQPEEPTVESPVSAAGEEESVLDRLKRRRDEIRAKSDIDMDIPGYDGELVAKFKRMPWEALKKIAENAEASRSSLKELFGHADVLATACEALYIRRQLPGGESQLTPLNELYHDDFGDVPVRFDPRLSTWLGLRIDGNPTARKVVLAVFNNDLAVTAMHNELGAWMQSSKNEEDRDF